MLRAVSRPSAAVAGLVLALQLGSLVCPTLSFAQDAGDFEGEGDEAAEEKARACARFHR